MASGRMGAAVREIRALIEGGSVAGLTEGQLLQRFASGRDEAAFEALVHRHGPKVLGVCRRVLGDEHAAEDAFQATFLVLARKAGAIGRPDRLEGWLAGVARRTALKARAVAARRRAVEGRAGRLEATTDPPPDDLRPLLDEELDRLPDDDRRPLVLCDLEGRTIDEAARLLGLPRGTVGTRLARARARLRGRLARRGVALGAGLLASASARGASAVPVALREATTRAALAFTGGGAAPERAAALARGVLSGMNTWKWKVALLTVATIGLGALGAGRLARGARPERPAAEPAGAEAEAVAKGDREALQGTWGVVKATLNGNGGQAAREFQRQKLVVKGDKITFRWPEGGRPDRVATFTLDPKADPKAIDLTTTPPEPARTIRGIYELEDDRWRVAFLVGPEPDADRPKDFVNPAEAPNTLVLLDLVPEAKLPKKSPAEREKEAEGDALARGANQLKQVAIALFNYDEANGHLPPPAIRDEKGKALLSWRVAILPQLAHQELYDRFRKDEPWDSPHNKALLAEMPAVFAPSRPERVKAPHSTLLRVFAGPGTAFDSDEGVEIAEFTDGLHKVLIAVEAGDPIPWTKPEDFAYVPGTPLPRLAGPHKGGVLTLWGDGVVRFVEGRIDPKALEEAILRADGSMLDPDSLSEPGPGR